MVYNFDGTYTGFLTAVFESFERKHHAAKPTITPLFHKEHNLGLFEQSYTIHSNPDKAKRVYQGLKKTLTSLEISNLFKVYLSEDPDALKALFYIIQQLFLDKPDILKNFADPAVILFDKTLTRVNRERHRMKAFIRFQKGDNNMFHAIIEPDFNVLPLIIDFFRKRYADQPWMIYDVKRKYGMYYDLNQVSEIELSAIDTNALSKPHENVQLDERETHFQTLWHQYFNSTNIVARKNMKLHIQHVPKRYWKYLVEKN